MDTNEQKLRASLERTVKRCLRRAWGESESEPIGQVAIDGKGRVSTWHYGPGTNWFRDDHDGEPGGGWWEEPPCCEVWTTYGIDYDSDDRCDCYDYDSGEATPDCDECDGRGFREPNYDTWASSVVDEHYDAWREEWDSWLAEAAEA